jgi:membrane protein
MAATTRTQEHRPDTNGLGPEEPTDLSVRSWWGVLKRTVREFREDNLTDWAAALTYYAILSIFPALLAVISVLGLIGESATQPLLDNLTEVAPGAAQEIVTDAIQNLNQDQGAAGILFVIGLAIALWSASGYVGAFMRASNAIYEREEGRPFWKLRPIQILVTLVLVLMAALVVLALIVSGPVAEAIGSAIGLGDAAVTAWNIAKWPVLLVVAMVMLAILYWSSPNAKVYGFRWVTPGSVVAVVAWIVASVGFAFYVANFSSYNKTYGALAGVIVFLVWMWITNIAVLFGAELNAETERARELEAGVPGAEEEIQAPYRDVPKEERERAGKA